MKLVCPACGATASAEAWTNDAACRITIDLLLKLPGPIARRTLPYLGLFRRGERGLTWTKAQKIVTELGELVALSALSWDGQEPRPMTVDSWAAALDAVAVRQPKALENHNYLRHTAYELAGRKEQGRREPGPRRADPEAEGGSRRIPDKPPTCAGMALTKEQIELNKSMIGQLIGGLAGKMRVPEKSRPGEKKGGQTS